LDNNPVTSSGAVLQTSRISGLTSDLNSAFTQINGLSATPGFASRSATNSFSTGGLDGLNTQNGVNETFVINVTSDFSNISAPIDITGDAGDIYFLRWDTNAISLDGYQGTVKFNNTTGLTPHGGLGATNFINVAGDLNSSGGSGGFFNGYWLTTGDPSDGETSPFSNANFQGGWYSTTTKFSLTSGSRGDHLDPPVVGPPIDVPLPSGALSGLVLSGVILSLRRIGHRRSEPEVSLVAAASQSSVNSRGSSMRRII
jgi:hypothetical protein